jgi:hypothetical protein
VQAITELFKDVGRKLPIDTDLQKPRYQLVALAIANDKD